MNGVFSNERNGANKNMKQCINCLKKLYFSNICNI